MQQYHSSWRKKTKDWGHKFKRNYQNPYFKKKSPLTWRLKISLILLVAALSGWIYLFYYSSYFDIKHLEFIGLVETPEQEFKTLVDQYLSQHKALIFKRNNIFIFDQDDLKEYVNETYSFENIEVAKTYPNKVAIKVSEKSSAFIWQEAEQKLLVDKNGEVIKYYSSDYDYLNLPIIIGPFDLELEEEILEKNDIEEKIGENDASAVNDSEASIENNSKTSNGEIVNNNINNDAEKDGAEEAKKEPKQYKIGQKIISSEKAQFLLEAYEYIKNNPVLDLKFSRFEMPEMKEPQLNLVFTNGLKIYFNLNNNLEQQVNTFNFLVNEKLKDNVSGLKYIDLRFGDKVYYK